MSSLVARICSGCLIVAFGGAQTPAQQAAPPPTQSTLDVKVLFASNCGFCHSDGGRVAGRGPQLMDTKRDNDFLRARIKSGKEGAMPAFGAMFSEADIDAIVKYIHDLKPEHQG
jgi:mono/diheme cytochrome c family protein